MMTPVIFVCLIFAAATLAFPATTVQVASTSTEFSTSTEDNLETTSPIPTSDSETSKPQEINNRERSGDTVPLENIQTNVPGVQIETDILLLIPETVAEEGPLMTADIPVGYIGKPRGGLRSLAEQEYDYENEQVLGDDEDMEVAESIVFRPLFRYRKDNAMRRRIYRNRPYRQAPIRRCSPCPPYYV